MMTGPIDANIMAYIDKQIDEKLLGDESLEIEKKLEELEARVESLELLDLQQQILRMGTDAKSLATIVLEAARYSAEVHISMLATWALDWRDLNARATPSYTDTRETVISMRGTSMADARASQNPIAVGNKFWNSITDLFNDSDYRAFMRR